MVFNKSYSSFVELIANIQFLTKDNHTPQESRAGTDNELEIFSHSDWLEIKIELTLLTFADRITYIIALSVDYFADSLR